jgi:glycosyltransferase involved in cell wall biosynthesis
MPRMHESHAFQEGIKPSLMKRNSIVIATTTWNAGDTIEQFINHHLAGDVARIFVMDFGSDDGTLDLLQPYRNSGTVQVLTLPSLQGKDSSNVLLDQIRSSPAAPEWCLFIDPDEFVSSPASLVSAFSSVPDDALAVNLPRFNVTGVRPRSIQHCPVPFADLMLKIRQRSRRSAEDRRARYLNPPWIFTEILGKVAVRVRSGVAVGHGDHSASGNTRLTLNGQELLHFPIRAWEKFEEKIRLAKMDFKANSHLNPDFAWHWRRWIAIHEAGALASEYLEQFIDAGDVERLIQGGVLENIKSSNKLD